MPINSYEKAILSETHRPLKTLGTHYLTHETSEIHVVFENQSKRC